MVAVTSATPTHPPRHRHRPKPKPTPKPTPPPVRVTSTAKGVSAWSFPGVTRALALSGASWYYTWSAGPGVSAPSGVSFVPMIWGAANVTSATLAQVRGEGHILLGFNEPDLASQSNLTVSKALSLWPKLMATGMTLGSPAVADDAATPGSWLARFMSGAHARGYRVNFITVHWYGGDFATAAAVSQLKSYLQAIYARYHLPIWLTEFGLANFGGSPAFPSRGPAGRVPHRRDHDAGQAGLHPALRLVRAAGVLGRRHAGPVLQRAGGHAGRPRLRSGGRVAGPTEQFGSSVP